MYPDLYGFEDSKSGINGRFHDEKSQIFPREKIPASRFDQRSNETNFYETKALQSALASPDL